MENADEIGVGVGTVKSTAARARVKIRDGAVGAGGSGDPGFMKGVS